MIHAVRMESVYLSFVTMASCQQFYDEMFEEFEVPEIDLISRFNPNSLEENVQSFKFALDEWENLYDKFGVKINRYEDLGDFERAYLGG